MIHYTIDTISPWPDTGFSSTAIITEIYAAWRYCRQAEGEKNYLGMGIIRFAELEIEPQESEVKYRVDMEVIISVSLSTGTEKTP